MHGYGGPEVLRVDDVPIPEPGAGQVRVRIHSVGINPFEWKLREGRMRARIELKLPHIPGFDVAGVIDKLGAGADSWKFGDAVVAALHRAPQGGYAQYAVVSIEDIVMKPATLSFDEAACLPTAGTTAWRFLVELAGLRSGQIVFIQGGAGGVGSAAVQIAKARGARVITTASAHNVEYLRSLGADEIINYRVERFEPHMRSADIVLDTVGGEVLERSAAAMQPGATLVCPAGPPPAEQCERAQIKCPPAVWPPSAFGPRLREITALVEAGKFRVNIDKVFALEDASIAQELNRQAHTRGKIVLRVC
jgi:NADPH:quinone reductase-like Zn-dependent oxidoreductase